MHSVTYSLTTGHSSCPQFALGIGEGGLFRLADPGVAPKGHVIAAGPRGPGCLLGMHLDQVVTACGPVSTAGCVGARYYGWMSREGSFETHSPRPFAGGRVS